MTVLINGTPLDQVSPESAEFYRDSMLVLRNAGVPFLVGGAFALAEHSGVARQTKDLDLFVLPEHRDWAISVLAKAGYDTEIRFPFWLAKACSQGQVVDLIYRSPNGVGAVNDSWFERGTPGEMLGVQVNYCAPEEMILTKTFVLNNDRNDLADVMHLFFSCAERLDWNHLVKIFEGYWRVLLAHMVLFGFVYPSENHRLPKATLKQLADRLHSEEHSPSINGRVCNGTLLSHSQYRPDVEHRGFADGRVLPYGKMSDADVIDATISLDDFENRKSAQANLSADESVT